MEKLKLVILIPVLRRPQNISPLVQSIKSNTMIPSKHKYEILFIASPSDDKEINALKEHGANFIVMPEDYEGHGDYAKKINTGFKSIAADWYLTGADDIKFHSGWFEAAMNIYAATKACVIGTNDMGNPRVTAGRHSTHTLVLKEYIDECGTIDEPGKIFHEGYHHNFCDDELVQTAKWRGAWAFSKDSRVEHNHPLWRPVPLDEIYTLGRKFYKEDERLYNIRKKLWD
jgi:glycosyltransferase involved in cell wall biosynthesis